MLPKLLAPAAGTDECAMHMIRIHRPRQTRRHHAGSGDHADGGLHRTQTLVLPCYQAQQNTLS